MKLSGGKAAGYLRHPTKDPAAILFYGPDVGLVRERSKHLIKVFGGDNDFSVTECTGDDIRRDPPLLSDQASAMSLMGGDPVLCVRDATDGLASIVESWLDGGRGINPVIFEGSDLAARSKLRQLFEKRKETLCIACYADEGRDLASVVREHLRSVQKTIEPAAEDVLCARLGEDRMAIRRDLEKLVLYVGDKTTIDLADVDAVIDDQKGVATDDIVYAIADGNRVALATALARAEDASVEPLAVLRIAQMHFEKLLTATTAMAEGRSSDSVVKGMRPPIFFKRQAAFRRQVETWRVSSVIKTLNLLLTAEKDCKLGHSIDRILFERSMMQICLAAEKSRR